jgi:SAM-dependent methyltransferase
MIHFICNVCAQENSSESIDRETPSCAKCGSNVRIRGMIQMLSMELFNQALPLTEFPVLPWLKGVGLSDDWRYATPLAEKFNYVNTYFDREPFLDITQPHPHLYGTYDFILSSEVFEHVPVPVERALEECHKLLKPNGFLCATVPFNSEGETREHYPDLYEYATVNLAGRPVLVNRKRDGTIEVHEELMFHGGLGATLEMREFSQSGLVEKLTQAGFTGVRFQSEPVPRFGIYPEGNFSIPFIAAKERFALNGGGEPADDDLTRQKLIVEMRAKLASVKESHWIKLGRRFGLGPRL